MKPHPSPPGPEDAPNGPVLAPPLGQMSEGPVLPGKSGSHTWALGVPETPLSPFTRVPPWQSTPLTLAYHVSEAEGGPLFQAAQGLFFTQGLTFLPSSDGALREREATVPPMLMVSSVTTSQLQILRFRGP